jgi:hypothetical protein
MKKDLETLQKFIAHCDEKITILTAAGKTTAAAYFADLKSLYQAEIANL